MDGSSRVDAWKAQQILCPGTKCSPAGSSDEVTKPHDVGSTVLVGGS